MLQCAKIGTRSNNGAALRAEEDGGVKKSEGTYSKWRIPLSEDEVRRVTECLIILGQDAYIKEINLGKVMVESGKGNLLCMIRKPRSRLPFGGAG